MKRSAGVDARKQAQQEFELLDSKPKFSNGRKQAGELREGAVGYMPIKFCLVLSPLLCNWGGGSQKRKCRVV